MLNDPVLFRRAERDIENVGLRASQGIKKFFHFRGLMFKAERRRMGARNFKACIPARQNVGAAFGRISTAAEQKDIAVAFRRALCQTPN